MDDVAPPTRFVIEFTARDPGGLARWWADALGWLADSEGGEEVVHPIGAGVPLHFVPSNRDRPARNDTHLDLHSDSHRAQQELVQRLFNAGAHFADIGQGDEIPWVVLTDPEGNEFCVLEPRKSYEDTGVLAAIVVDCDDPREHARAWAEETGMPVVSSEREFVDLRPATPGPYLEFRSRPPSTGQRGSPEPASMVRVRAV